MEDGNTKQCVYCRLAKASFNKEHVVPISFGGDSRYLSDLVCSDCNSKFSRDFEGKFLKGSGIESFFRAAQGQKGRHEYPVFGDGSYGNRLYVTINERHPPIQIFVSREGLIAPIQLISVSIHNAAFYALHDSSPFHGSSDEFLDGLWAQNPDRASTVSAFLWVRDTDITVNNYRFLRKQFYKFLGKNNLEGEILCDTVQGFPVTLDWETKERQRMFSKMCMNSLLMVFPSRDFGLMPEFDRIRTFILDGVGDGENIVQQWTADFNPVVDLLGTKFDLALGIFEHESRLFGTVFIPKVGMFILRIARNVGIPFDKIRKGLQPMNDNLCLFFTTSNGDSDFLIAFRNISDEIRRRLVTNVIFAEKRSA